MSSSEFISRLAAKSYPDLDPAIEGIQVINPFSIDPGDGIQTRANINDRAVSRYIDAMLAGDRFPPAVVYIVDGLPKLVDGFHRLAAALETIGETKQGFEVQVIFGSASEALKAALITNTQHGVQLTGQDDERRFLLASSQPELRGLSYRKMAAFLGMSLGKIQRLRAKHRWTTEATGAFAYSSKQPEDAPKPSFSTLGPLAVPFRKPQSPVPLSDLASQIIDLAIEASDRAVAKGLKYPGEFLAGVLKRTVGELGVAGRDLDRAIREIDRLAVWLHKSREVDGLLVAGEIALRDSAENPDY
jgi:hypothetical protein